MLRNRHGAAGVIDAVPTGRGWMPPGHHLEAHTHDQGQLVYAAVGASATTTAAGTWLSPANRVTWTPPGFSHAHRFYGRTDACVAVLPLELCAALPARPALYLVGPLLREALLALTERDDMRPDAQRRLLEVVLDELVEGSEPSLHLPRPQDDRLRAVTDLLHADPASPATLAQLGAAVGASERTLTRLFRAEFATSFPRWRTTLRIHHAVAHLTDGMSVTDTASVCGWSNPSGFIQAFTDLIGQTPGRYQSDLRHRVPFRRSPTERQRDLASGELA